MGVIIEKNYLDSKGVLLVKHYDEDYHHPDEDRSFNKLPVRKLRASEIGRDCDTELFLSASGVESHFDRKSLVSIPHR